MPTDKPRFSLTLPEEMYSEIIEYQHDNRLKNQTKAVVSLIEAGLNEKMKKNPAVKDDRKEKLIAMYDSLSEDNRSKLLELANLYLEHQQRNKGIR